MTKIKTQPKSTVPIQNIFLDDELFEYPICGDTINKMFIEIQVGKRWEDNHREEVKELDRTIKRLASEVGRLTYRLSLYEDNYKSVSDLPLKGPAKVVSFSMPAKSK
ncbi:MAG: hypothetical protein ABIP35_06325 [Ginsengibacter sp.]